MAKHPERLQQAFLDIEKRSETCGLLGSVAYPPSMYLDEDLLQDNPEFPDTSFVFVVGSDSSTFDQLENLIGSIQHFEPNMKVLLYDIGLSEDQRKSVSDWCGVSILQFPF